jgi:Na(+)/H(+) exchange regulatory cofactor NHE-RF2
LERNNLNNANINLNMTAKELRAQLASRKKYDPKKEAMDFKKKYDIVQKL